MSPPHPVPHVEEVALAEVEEEQTKHAYPGAASTSAAAVPATKAAVPATKAAVEVVPLAKVTQFTGKSKEEVATIRIQTAFRGYLVCFCTFLYSCYSNKFRVCGSISFQLGYRKLDTSLY